MEELKQRFPEDLAYDVFWDTTVFVTATIDEVVHTLVIAFVLVAIVVFLFLGKLRTTLIPADRRAGVDHRHLRGDAGDRLHRQHRVAAGAGARHRHRGRRRDRGDRERRARDRGGAGPLDPRGDQEGDGGDHRADHRHHPGAAVGVRAGGVHSRHQRPAVPPVRGRGLDLDGDLGDQRADAQPGALLGAAEARRDRGAARCAMCCGAIDWSRDGYACDRPPAGARRGGRRRRRAGRGRGRRSGCSRHHAARASCRPRTRARFFAAMRLPEGASLNRTEAIVAQVEEHHRADPRRAGRAVGGRPQLHRLRRLVQPGVLRHPAEALRPAHRRRRRASTPSSPGCGRSSPRSRAPSSSRSTCRRSSASAAPAASSTCSRRCRASRRPTSPRSCAALLVAANQQPELAGVFSTFAADTPQVYLDIDRDKAQVLGVKVSDIFNALQSTLGGFYVNDFNLFGRTWQVNVQAESPLPRRDRRHLPRLCPQQRRRHGADPRARAGAARPGAAGGDPLQRLPRRGDQRRAQARLQLGPGARRDGAALGHDPAARATASNGPAPRSRRRRPAARPASCSGSRCCSPTCSWWRSTRAGTSRCRCCCRSASACWARSSRVAAVRPRVRRLCPDRPRRAGGARGQERHPDRRVRRRAAARRASRSSSRRSKARGCASGR